MTDDDHVDLESLGIEPKGLQFAYIPDGYWLRTFLDAERTRNTRGEIIPIKALIIEGPLSSGTSTACCHKLFKLAARQAPNPADGLRYTRWAVVRNTFKELISSTLKTWMDWYGTMGRLVMDPPPRFFLTYADIRMEVWFIALDRPEHTQKIRSTEWTGGWWNEVQYSDLDLFAELATRLGRYPPKRWWTKPGSTDWIDGIPDDFRVPTSKMLLGDCNTGFEDHWINTMFRKGPLPQGMDESKRRKFAVPEGWILIKQPPAVIEKIDPSSARPTGEYLVNARSVLEREGVEVGPNHEYAENLNWAGGGQAGEAGGVEYYTDAMAAHDADWIRMTLMGIPGSRRTGARIYPEFFEHLHCAREPIEAHPLHTLLVGIDPGFVRSGATFSQKIDGRWLVLSDLMRTNVKTEAFGDAIWNHIAEHYPDHMRSKKIRFWIDPYADRNLTTGGEKHIELLRSKCNIHCQTSPKANFVRRGKGVDVRKQAMSAVARRAVGEHRGILIGPNAPLFKRGVMGTYCWKADANGVVLEPAEVDKKSLEADVVESFEYVLVGEGEARDALGRPDHGYEPIDVRAPVNLFARPKSSLPFQREEEDPFEVYRRRGGV